MNKIYKKAISVISLLAVFYMPLPSGPSAAQAALEGQDSQSRGYIVQFIDEPLIARWQESQAFLANSQTKSYRQRLDDNFSAHKFSLEQLVTNLNSENIQEFKNVFSGVYLNISDEEAEKIKKLDFVKSVYPNYRVEASLMDSVSQIGAAEVWNSGYTGEGVTIAIIDTGIDYTHPDFAGKVIGGYDFVHNDSDPMDDHGHGTHVAGIAAGNGALKGVAPDADLLAYKVLNSQGSGWSNKIISAIERAVDPNQDGDFSDKADIISMSFGGGGNPDDPMSTAVDNAVKAGVVAVAAAGNSGPSSATITSPGTAREAITVGAVDKNDNIAFFSSRGPVKWGGEILVKPDIVAPGVGICSAQWDSAWNNSKCFDDDHVSLSGTSMATPHVVGAAALLLQKNPDWNPEEVKMALRSGADNLGFDINAQGYGRLNILNAVGLSEIPSIAKINTSGTVSGKIDIVGTAGGKFSHYALYYGGGDNPDDWQKITEGANQINNDILYRGFDTALLSEGNNFFRLVVWNQNGEPSEDRSMVIVDNIKINKPFNNDIYRAGELLEITGTILGSGNGFTVDYGLRERPTEWSSEGITLTNGGTGDIANGVIAAWDTSSIVKSDFYTIRVNINYPNGETSPEYAKNIYFDATLKQGWPVRLDLKTSSCPFGTSEFYTLIDPSSKNQNQEASPKTLTKDELLALSGNDNHANGGGGCHYWLGMLEPVVADIDNDGLSEIVVFEGGAPPEIKVFKPDGSLFWSALIGQGEVLGGNLTVPLVGDINNDGYKEIIAHNNNINDGYSELSAFDHNGSLLWSTRVAKDYQPTMLIADLDLDGNNEIVVKGNDSNDRQMVIINHLGEIISQWSLPHITWSASIVSTPAVGNFDDDPDLEIVSAGPSENAGYDFENKKWINEGVIYVYNMDGSVVPGWPVYTNGVIWSSPAVGDINRDGENEIVIGVMAGADTHRPDLINGGVYAFDEKGKVLPGWPVEKGWDFWSSPSLADFDGNGDLEIAISRLGFSTYVIHNDGKIASGWPQFTGWNDYYSTIVGDINNDGIPDVLTTAGSAVVGGGVYAWNFDGNPIEGFPKFTEADAQAPATIADIDNDGKLELVASSDWDYDFINKKYKLRETIYVWELEGNLNQEKMAWPMFHLDSQHAGFYSKISPCASLYKGILEHYLSFYGDGRYDSAFDLDKDGKINVLDFTLLAAHVDDQDWCDIRLKVIVVLSPNGGEELIKGQYYDIIWTSEKIKTIDIEAFAAEQNLGQIVSDIDAAVGKYSWQIPLADFGGGFSLNAVKIRISDADNATVSDESDDYFSIIKSSSPPPPPPPPPPTTACASLQDGIKERYLSFYGDGRYDPVFDLNKDNKINVLDISLFAMHSDEETWCSLALQ